MVGTQELIVDCQSESSPSKELKESESVSQLAVSDSFTTPQTEASQAPLSMGFPRKEYWSGSPFPSPEDLPDPGIKPRSPALQRILYCLIHEGIRSL